MLGSTAPWWRTAVFYEIYLRSFADGNDDGEGDLIGLIDRLPYLAQLGVDALWIAPWYPSPFADGGYDVSDYRSIHPLFGTLDDAERLLDEAHRSGLRVIIDLVANHTSSQHPWFAEALASESGCPARARYFFRDGRGTRGELPPNNWISAFGGPAWTRESDSGQWYLHTFAPQQPDLDWDSSEVLQEFDSVIKFWLDRGVDGFRIDAISAIGKKPGLPDADYGEHLRFASSEWVDNPHWDVDSLHGTLRRWRAVLDDYPGDRMFVAEAVVNGPERLARYLRPGELHSAFTFDLLHAPWEAPALREAIDSSLLALESVGAPATWVLSNHDETRHLTRLSRGTAAGAADGGTRRARAAILLILALPGATYLYQGEELGLAEVEDLPEELLQDPVFERSQRSIRGRDGCRVPLPWSGEVPPFGFSSPGTTTWLPQPASWDRLTAATQTDDADSMLELYRLLLRVRRRFSGTATEEVTWLASPDGVLDFRRGPGLRCVVNLGPVPHRLDGTPTLASVPLRDGVELPTDAAAWFVELP